MSTAASDNLEKYNRQKPKRDIVLFLNKFPLHWFTMVLWCVLDIPNVSFTIQVII